MDTNNRDVVRAIVKAARPSDAKRRRRGARKTAAALRAGGPGPGRRRLRER